MLLQCYCCDPHSAPVCSTCCAGLGKAKRQLEVTGKVLTWLVHYGNPKVAAATPLQLHGVIAVQGWPTAEEEQELRQAELDVSCPGLDASSGATMQLELYRF